jgi:hypothetical protein
MSGQKIHFLGIIGKYIEELSAMLYGVITGHKQVIDCKVKTADICVLLKRQKHVFCSFRSKTGRRDN